MHQKMLAVLSNGKCGLLVQGGVSRQKVWSWPQMNSNFSQLVHLVLNFRNCTVPSIVLGHELFQRGNYLGILNPN